MHVCTYTCERKHKHLKFGENAYFWHIYPSLDEVEGASYMHVCTDIHVNARASVWDLVNKYIFWHIYISFDGFLHAYVYKYTCERKRTCVHLGAKVYIWHTHLSLDGVREAHNSGFTAQRVKHEGALNLFMYVCMYVCVYIYIHTHANMHVCVYIYI